MYKNIFKLVPLITLSTWLIACSNSEYENSHISSVVSSTNIGFCELSEQNTSSKHIWGAQEVQFRINELKKNSPFSNTPHGAYASAYISMTHDRDSTRCNSNHYMYPKNKLDAKINDYLSQIMTENYLKSVQNCFTGSYSELNGFDMEWCNLLNKSESKNWNSFRTSLGHTAIYLSSHLTLAISALPVIEEIWKDTEYKSLEDRINRVVQFKGTYDSFNYFLSQNVTTVISSLQKAGYFYDNGIDYIPLLSKMFPRFDLLFGNIRDTSFNLGIELATSIKTNHPWLVENSFSNSDLSNTIIYNKIKEHSLKTLNLLANPLTAVIPSKRFSDFY